MNILTIVCFITTGNQCYFRLKVFIYLHLFIFMLTVYFPVIFFMLTLVYAKSNEITNILSKSTSIISYLSNLVYLFNLISMYFLSPNKRGHMFSDSLNQSEVNP